ncbi:MAG: hypothetical protein ACYTEG_16580 [Planctomycetota bacterium]
MLVRTKSRRRKRLFLSLLATISSLLAWQHLEGIGLGDRQLAKLEPEKSQPA